jgi:predicted GIY-YIG superfamily endonuclease
MGCAQSERRREENVGTMVEMTKAVAREKREKMWTHKWIWWLIAEGGIRRKVLLVERTDGADR